MTAVAALSNLVGCIMKYDLLHHEMLPVTSLQLVDVFFLLCAKACAITCSVCWCDLCCMGRMRGSDLINYVAGYEFSVMIVE